MALERKFIFLSFSVCLISVWLEMKPKWRFLIFFDFFYYFFWIFFRTLQPRSSGNGNPNEIFFFFFFFFFFFGLSQFDLDRNEVRMMFFRFFNFLLFFGTFLGMLHPGLGITSTRKENFFLLFFGLP